MSFKNCRLTSVRFGFGRPVEDLHRRELDAQTLFTDGGQLLTISESTVDWMNDLLKKKYGPAFRKIDSQVFRGNILLRGLQISVEDVAESFTIECPKGDTEMLCGGMCVRCDVTRVVQDTGQKPDKEPLSFLASERPQRPESLDVLGPNKKNSSTMGVNTVFKPEAEGIVLKKGYGVVVNREKREL